MWCNQFYIPRNNIADKAPSTYPNPVTLAELWADKSFDLSHIHNMFCDRTRKSHEEIPNLGNPCCNDREMRACTTMHHYPGPAATTLHRYKHHVWHVAIDSPKTLFNHIDTSRQHTANCTAVPPPQCSGPHKSAARRCTAFAVSCGMETSMFTLSLPRSVVGGGVCTATCASIGKWFIASCPANCFEKDSFIFTPQRVDASPCTPAHAIHKSPPPTPPPLLRLWLRVCV